METVSLISIMKRALLAAHLDQEIEVTCESNKAEFPRDVPAKEVPELTSVLKDATLCCNADSDSRTLKIGHRDVVIIKKWSVAMIISETERSVQRSNHDSRTPETIIRVMQEEEACDSS